MNTTGTTGRPRILQIAYTCGPGFGSEPGIGWHRALESARHFDTWVITRQQHCREWITGYLRQHGEIANLHFVFLPLSAGEQRLARLPGWAYYAYNRWQRRALATAQKLHKEIGFDLTHQVTFGGYREPSYLWQMDVPFVWGPIGGTQNYPWHLLPAAGAKTACYEACRSVANALQLRFARRVHTAARRAAALLASNSTIADHIERFTNVRPEVLCDIGVESIFGHARGRRRAADPLKILWAGVLEPRKALEILIEALAQLPADVRFELRVLGEGPMLKRWQNLARRKQVDAHIRWLGRVPHEEALRQFQWADVFAFTSLRDTTGTVVTEALAGGAPVICLDHQGCGDIVDDRCGRKVPVGRRREMARRFAEHLAEIARQPELLSRLSRGALRQAERYLWSEQGRRMAAVYERVLCEAARRPKGSGAGRSEDLPAKAPGAQAEAIGEASTPRPIVSPCS